MRTLALSAAIAATLLLHCAHAAQFDYRGTLTDGDAPANGRYDLQVTVYDSKLGGRALATPIVLSNVAVSDGRFTAPITLDDVAVQFSLLQLPRFDVDPKLL